MHYVPLSKISKDRILHFIIMCINHVLDMYMHCKMKVSFKLNAVYIYMNAFINTCDSLQEKGTLGRLVHVTLPGPNPQE